MKKHKCIGRITRNNVNMINKYQSHLPEQTLTCVECGKIFRGRRNRKTCSPECQQARDYRKKKESYIPHPARGRYIVQVASSYRVMACPGNEYPTGATFTLGDVRETLHMGYFVCGMTFARGKTVYTVESDTTDRNGVRQRLVRV